MATDISSLPVNGSHGPHSGYDSQQAYNSSQSYANESSNTPNASAATTSGISKDEVGWYFVEQYYTTLSRSPEKLYLFYNKRSQFVLGDETDKVAVCVGQKSINERIKDLDFQECKVRVTNVDSQSSDANIVIQVIGEISNKSQPHKKFVQTFILAGQTNGYFVLNDIFRYLVDEEEEEVPVQTGEAISAALGFEEPPPAATNEASETLTTSDDPQAIEESARLVDQELEESKNRHGTAAGDIPAVNGTAPVVAEDEAPVPAEAVEPPTTSLETEQPKEPSPTPAKSTPTPQAAAAVPAPPAQTKPAVPKTWATLAAAANRSAAPAVPAQASSTPATAQTKSTPAAPATSVAPSAQASSQPAAVAEAPAPRESSPAANESDEWTSVGDNRRQQSRAQSNAATQEGPRTQGYISKVNESVENNQLRSLLEKFGEVTYLDINRQKNCAFVEFKTPEGYKAAVAANPHQLGSDRIVVEERRFGNKGTYGFVQRGGIRGGRGGPNQGPGRGSFQGGRGGNVQGRGRGGGPGGPKPRGGPAAA